VLSQSGVHAVPLVVFNGPAIDPELVRKVEADSHTRVLVREQADLPSALQAGRRLVEEPWFAELDDDDELLPGALALRVQTLMATPGRGAVVTNGIRRGARDTVHIANVEAVAAEPLPSLLQANWLLPGSWLCRTDSVADSIFDGMPRYLECTYLAVRLASSTTLSFVQTPTVVYYEDTPGSESKTPAYILGQEAALQRILELELPHDVRRVLELRLAPACSAAASVLAASGDRRAAWRRWRRGLRHPGGWRVLPYAPSLHCWRVRSE
jgi:hypothetical protein